MENIGIGFFQGFGGFFGVVIGLLIVAIIIRIIIALVEKYISSKEMPGILLDYRKFLKKQELYEQLAVINKYKDEHKKNKLPKELSKLYSLKIFHFLDVEPYEDKEGGRMRIGSNRVLIYHKPDQPNNKVKKNNNSEPRPKSDTENRPNNNQDTNDIS